LVVLSESEISKRLSAIEGWRYVEGAITRSFTFDSFMAGIAFVERVARAAEEADHHPDFDIRYSTVTVSVSSHDVNGITERDFRLASAVNKLA